jgi:hypothetical protein
MPVEKVCGPAIGTDVPPERPNSMRPLARIGYHSRVCSITGDAIERIAEAIDQLAGDIQGTAEAELTARVADIWLMMGALDPELARRQRQYTTPSDGTLSF